MNTDPKVSVIIPNYNHARYLPQRIESVLGQTFQNFEVIVLDDCSVDNSREIIEHFAASDNRIKTVFNNENSGSTFKQWNRGFQLAKGEYVWLAESDDYADPHFLDALLSVMEADKKIGMAYCDSWDVHEETGIIQRNPDLYKELDPVLWTHDFTTEGIDLVRKFMSYRNIVPNASAVLLRASMIKQAGPANERFKLVGDWLYWAGIMEFSKISFIAKPLNYYRHHGKTVRSQTLVNGLYFEELSLLLSILRRYGEPDPVFLKKAIDTTLKMWFTGMVMDKIPLGRHVIIFKNLNRADKNFKHLFAKKFRAFLFANRFRGLKLLASNYFPASKK